jgi:hypothetical protein
VKNLIFQFLEFSENFFPGSRKTERHEEILFWDWQSIDFGTTGIPATSRNRPVKNQHKNKNQQKQQRNSEKQQ